MPQRVRSVGGMMDILILLSGRIGAGKSAIGGALAERYGAAQVSTRQILESRAGTSDRGKLQKLGAELDRADDGKWVAHEFCDSIFPQVSDSRIVLVAAIRTSAQATAFRQLFGRRVLHVHV